MNALAIQLNPYLTFNGQCEAAFRFYEQCLGGKIEFILRYESRPASEFAIPAGWGKKILHATMRVGDQVLNGADLPPERYQKPQGFSVMLWLADPAEAERIFKALAEAGTVTMPIQETFWSIRFGELVDRFGVPWKINCGRPAGASSQ